MTPHLDSLAVSCAPHWRNAAPTSNGFSPICHVAPERRGVHVKGVEKRSLEQRIAANLQQLRQRKGLTLVELAERCEPKASYQMVSRLEKGERQLTPDWIEKLAKALNVEPLDLIVGDRGTPDFRLSEQVANEVARVLGTIACEGNPPSDGTIQVLSLMLQELTLTFARHPEALRDPAIVRPVTDFLARQHARASN